MSTTKLNNFKASPVARKLSGFTEMSALLMADQVEKSLNELMVTEIANDGASTIVKANIKHIKKVGKSIGECRIRFTKPLDDAKSDYMLLEKVIKAPLITALDNAGKIMGAYVLAQKKKEEENRKKERSSQMNKEMFSEHLLIYVKNASDEAKSLVEFTKDSGMKKLREYFASYISDVPTDNSTFTILCSTYPDRIEDIKQAKSFLTIMGKHISGLYGGLSDKESVLLSLEAVSEEVQTHFNLSLEDVGEVEEQKINESHKSVESVTKGTYYKVEFEVLDITKVPKEFTKLVVDNEKVNAWKKENAQAITEEGKTIAGIKFTGELKVRG